MEFFKDDWTFLLVGLLAGFILLMVFVFAMISLAHKNLEDSGSDEAKQ